MPGHEWIFLHQPINDNPSDMITTNTTTARVDSPLAWRMAGVAFAVGFIVFGVLYSFGVFLDPLMTDLGASRSAVSALYAISSSAFYFLGPVTGWIGDRWGPRVVSAVGAAMMAIGLGATALVDSVWIAYLTYGLGVGFGAACAFIPTLAVLGSWFDRWRTRALSIAATGTGCGMLVLPPLAAVLIEHIGWRGAMIVVALIAGLSLAICAALVRAGPKTATAEVPKSLSSTLRSRAFVLMYVSWVFGTMALFVPFVFLPAFATDQGADPIAASWLISIIGGASIVGRLCIGYVTTSAGAILLYKISVLVMAGSYVIWLLLPDYEWLVVFAAVLGMAYGIRIALVAPVLIELFGSGSLGALLGAFFTATGIAGLAGPLMAGLTADLSGSHTGGIIAAIIMGVLGFAFILPLRSR
jgi:MFS family permease